MKALDEWVQREGYHDGLSLHYAALVGRTPLMKAALIKSLNEWTPFWAAGALLEGWGMADSEAAAALTERAARTDAAEIGQYLPQILGDPEAAGARLFYLLKADESKRLDLVIQGISKLKPLENEGEIVDAALQRLNDPDTFSMDSFPGTLILTFPTDERVKALARQSLKSPYPPTGAMVEAYASDEQFRVELGEAITPLPVHLRYQIVSDLPLFSDKGFAIEVLQDWDTERNGEVKAQASIQYHTLLLPAAEQAAIALAKLDKMLPCYGPDHEDRRQAAASGLIVLKELHRVVGKIEVIGHEGQPVNIPVTEGRRQNRVFLNLLGAEWLYVKQALSGDLSILTARIGPGELWERLAVVAADHPALTTDIVEQAEADPGLRRSSQFLALLGRLEPRSENLARACLAVIGDHDSNWHGWFDATEAASSLLAEQFRGDATIETRLLSLGDPDRVGLGVIMALSLGWRHNQILTQLEFRRRNSEIGSAELYTKYACIPLERLAGVLEQDLVWAQHNGFQADSIVRPLVARLNDDPQAVQMISERLFVSANPSVKASFCKLLAISGSSTPERDLWSREELKRQTHPEIPELGYDILTRSTRAVSLCLLESLGEATTSDGSVPQSSRAISMI